MWLLAGIWFVMLFEPQWWLAARGMGFGVRVPVLLFLGFAAMLPLGILNVKEWRRRWTWYAPFLAFATVYLLGIAFAPNAGMAFEGAQSMLLMWLMIVGTIVLVDTAPRAELLLFIYAGQFLIWTLWGGASGYIPWHTTLANYDGFGSAMVIGAGLCSFLALAADKKWQRRLFGVLVALCAVGMVASFARGAFLAALAVGGIVWLRSPRKGAALAAALICAATVFVAASLLHGGDYWSEMSTITEGANEETGADRWTMWTAAWRVFTENPVLGVGAKNWGVYVAETFRPGDIGGNYTYNPMMLYNRSLHSSYFQILSEHGVLGVAAFIWILVDFWRRNLVLRTAAAQGRWQRIGGTWHLRLVALGLEAAMVAWLVAAGLYSQSGKHWFYTLLALNLLLYTLVRLAPSGRSKPPAVERRPYPVGSGAISE